MKKLFSITITLAVLLAFCDDSFARNKPVKVTIYGGGTIPVGTFGDNNDANGNAGIDIQYSIDKHWSVYANGTYNFTNPKSDLIESSYIIETTAGPRYSNNLGGATVIGEVGGGLYTFGSKVGGVTSTDSKFGVNGGLGLEIPMSREVNFVGKIKFHNVFTDDESTRFLGGYAGVNYRF